MCSMSSDLPSVFSPFRACDKAPRITGSSVFVVVCAMLCLLCLWPFAACVLSVSAINCHSQPRAHTTGPMVHGLVPMVAPPPPVSLKVQACFLS